jgi:hypothetical protein
MRKAMNTPLTLPKTGPIRMPSRPWVKATSGGGGGAEAPLVRVEHLAVTAKETAMASRAAGVMTTGWRARTPGRRPASVSRWSPVRAPRTTNGLVAPNATDPRGLPTLTTSHPDVLVSRADRNLGAHRDPVPRRDYPKALRSRPRGRSASQVECPPESTA